MVPAMSGDRDKGMIPPELDAEMTPGVRAFVLSLIAHRQRLESQVENLQARVRELESQPGKTPQNSSLPPSTQHPHAKPERRPSRSKRKRGGQPGHPKHERALIPTDECTDVVPLKPTACRRCGTKLDGHDPEPWRHQVWELPEIKPLVTEYQRHRLGCPGCGETTCGELPPGVPESTAGPRLVALTALLMGCFRQSKRRVALFLEHVLNQPCSAGWVVKLQQQATAALQPSYEELKQQLPTQDALSIDESPTKESQQKAWLWTFVAAPFTVFAVRATRAASVLAELLGSEFGGSITCDRAKMYWSLGLDPLPEALAHRLQWCWAHLKRDFQALIDSGDTQLKRLGHDLMRPTRELFEVWARYRDGTITRTGFRRLMKPIRQEIDRLLLRGYGTAAGGMCRELYEHRDWLWTFVDIDGVEPTNNVSERALRHAVIWRKLSFGTQSAHGSRFVETLLTVVETCRQQSHSPFPFLTSAIGAHFTGQPAPSLLPWV